MKKNVLLGIIGGIAAIGIVIGSAIIFKHEHAEVIDAIVMPTCEATGLTEGKHCADCGDVLIPQLTIPALGHVEVIDSSIEPTCTTAGLTQGSHCSVCKKIIIEQKEIHTLAHTVIEDAAISATCTSTGLTQGSHCAVCETVLVAQEITPILPHTIVDDAAIEPTCTSTGLTAGTHCSVCETVIVAQEEIPMAQHIFDEEYDRFCNVCNYERQINCRHDIPERIETIPSILPTCEQAGLTPGKYCTVCDKIIISQKPIEATGHTVVVDPEMAPTCEAIGRTEGTHCSVCNKILIAQIAISPLGHVEVDDEALDPTCSSEGKTAGSHCVVCNKILVKQETVEKLPHTVVNDGGIEATCTSTGLTNGSHCDVCEAIIVKQKEIPMLEHIYDGYDDEFCNTCGYKRENNCLHDVPEKIEIIPSVSSTCTETGLTEGRKCTICGSMVLPQSVIAKIACIESDWIIDKEPTHSENGAKHTECTMCKKIMQEETLPAGNTMLEFTLLHDGTYECSGVGACTDTDIVIPSEYNGVKVTSIAKNAFYECSSITSITIPTSVTNIGENAFYGCISIANVYYEGDVEGWCKINFENTYSNPMAPIYYHNNSKTYYPTLSNLDFIIHTGELLDSDDEYCSIIDDSSKNILFTLVGINGFAKNSYTASEMHSFLTTSLLSEDISLFEVKQLYGLYLFDQVENQRVNFMTMLEFMISITDTEEGKIFIDENTKANLLELYNALSSFKDGVEKELTKEEFTAMANEQLGSAIGSIAGVMFDSYNKKYNAGANENVKLIDLLRYIAYENSLSGIIFSSSADLKESLNNLFKIYDNIQSNCTYIEFLPLIEEIVVAFDAGEREINATNDDVQQAYIMYFYANNLIPDSSINGKEFVLFINNALDSNTSLSRLVSKDEKLKIKDIVKIITFVSNEEKLSYENMHSKLQELLSNVTYILPSSSISLDVVRDIYHNYIIKNPSNSDENTNITAATLYFNSQAVSSITIPESIKSIKKYTFVGCVGINEIIIPSTVENISACAFEDCVFATIYCKSQSRPSSWSYSWNYINRPVVWG